MAVPSTVNISGLADEPVLRVTFTRNRNGARPSGRFTTLIKVIIHHFESTLIGGS